MVLLDQRDIVRGLVASRDVFDAMLNDSRFIQATQEAASQVVRALRRGGKVLLCGNGGSAADAQHIAAEFISRLNFDRMPLPAIALTTDTSIITAIGNDYGFEYLFARQLAGLGQAGDVLIGISTSGNSPNVIAALTTARERGIRTIGMTGSRAGRMNALCDVLLAVPSPETPLIQQAHITLGHIICSLAEESMFPVEAADYARAKA